MKHLLMDPAFPDLVAAVAVAQRNEPKPPSRQPEPIPNDAAETFLTFLGRMEIASSRLW
jgi:hypothetical protein